MPKVTCQKNLFGGAKPARIGCDIVNAHLIIFNSSRLSKECTYFLTTSILEETNASWYFATWNLVHAQGIRTSLKKSISVCTIRFFTSSYYKILIRFGLFQFSTSCLLISIFTNIMPVLNILYQKCGKYCSKCRNTRFAKRFVQKYIRFVSSKLKFRNIVRGSIES